MTDQQKNWFNKLKKDRKESVRTLNKPSMSGIKNTIVEKYSDQAHFIYELLQNADDAKATKSSFKLVSDGLYFKHNGTILFSISNPETEDKDKKNNKLGHINSITSIANSTKTEFEIGKFGIGFKSVFQYTNSPHIYDPNFKFKIENFIVPYELSDDIPGRRKNETIFYFPFNRKEKDPLTAHSDILEKLKSLIYPTLFLTFLKEVSWSAKDASGCYRKKILKEWANDNLTCELIEVSRIIGEVETKEILYMFSRLYLTNNPNLKYSVGFFINEKGNLIPKNLPAFCYFITKETTNLNFIIHAPFLLNNSREGIVASNEHNKKLINLLAQLSADALIFLRDLNLIDDNILKVIPYNIHNFYDNVFQNFTANASPKLFAPFYSSIKNLFETETILPTADGYTSKKYAYWAQDNPVLEIFSDEQLSLLLSKSNAKWVFRKFVRNQTGKDEQLKKYISDCVTDWFEMSHLLKIINATFIEQQSIQWLHKFYAYLSSNNSYWSDIRLKPIFLNNNRKAVPAFEKINNNYYSVLFLPSDNFNSPDKTIHPDLLKDKKAAKFITDFGIKELSLKDEIYNYILPLYNNPKNDNLDVKKHFKIFFEFWKTKGRPEDFLSLIKDKNFILYKTKNNNTPTRDLARNIYYPTEELISYFESKPDTKFVAIDEYNSFITSENDRNLLFDFLMKLGVSSIPRIISSSINSRYQVLSLISTTGERLRINTNNFFETFDKILDGCSEILSEINKKKSSTLWNILSKLKLSELLGVHKYLHHTYHYQYFESTTIKQLNSSNWLLSVNNTFVSPPEITIEELNKSYVKIDDISKILHFRPCVNLTPEQRIAQLFKDEEEAKLAYELLVKYKMNQETQNFDDHNTLNTSSRITRVSSSATEKFKKTIDSLNELQSEFSSRPSNPNSANNSSFSSNIVNYDSDKEFIEGIENLKNQIELKNIRTELAFKISDKTNYSYEWFLAYLELLASYGVKQDAPKQKSIIFQEIKSFQSSNKYFLLRGADSYISPEIEAAQDINVTLIFGNGNKDNLNVDALSKKGQDLLIYCSKPLPSSFISQFAKIFKVELNFTPVLDLIDRLLKSFKDIRYIDPWEDIKEAMPPLNFIYGPPGTGKTTQICNKINHFISQNNSLKFLILTPTNKAADVICKKLYDINPGIKAVRLSAPTDPELEGLAIYTNVLKGEDLKEIDVVVSTIHRLPYFEILNFGLLFQYPWDFVIFDESSMIGIHYITFAIMALIKANNKTQFIIAGDPKQIPPVIEITDIEFENFDYQDENIYKIFNLESFNPAEQKLRPIDNIENLKTQYRSLPQIGKLFSEFSYAGLLDHGRSFINSEPKKLPAKFQDLISANITFIDVPLNNDNSIYKINKLFYSSYHIYSAILVSEIIKYFISIGDSQNWSIGLISPYKAQAVLLNKLTTSYRVPDNIKIYADTVHGFQGDECDIIFFICNSNNYSFTNHPKSLLTKEYIYNVAVSRAKDYLIIIHPFSVLSNPHLNKIRDSFTNNFGKSIIIKSSAIEQLIFNDQKYIENNCFVSGHDNVNLFGFSEMKYYIKSNEMAIDIELREGNSKTPI